MKVTFPKNIKKGFLAGMSINIGPLSLSIIQLFLVAIGIGISLAVFNSVSKTGGKAAGVLFAIPVLIIFIVVAFFKVSEMNILAFFSKMIRNKFFDVTKKFQSNSEKTSAIDIAIKESRTETNKKQIIEQKDEPESEKILKKIADTELI